MTPNAPEAYVMLDSTRSVAQKIQHTIIRIYAEKIDLKVSFYGAEFKGFESKHFQLTDYINNHPLDNFILFSIYQIYDNKNGFDMNLLREATKKNKKLYFATEEIKLTSPLDVEKIRSELIMTHVNIFNRDFTYGF